MKPTDREVSDWTLERLARGELSASEAERVRARLTAAGDPGGVARLAALAASSERILKDHPPAEVAAEICRRLHVAEARERAARAEGPRRSFVLLGGLATGAAALAALLLVVSPRPGVAPSVEEPAESTTIKGDKKSPQLTVYRQRRDAEKDRERLAPGGSVRAGDTVQMSYVSGGRAYGVLVSVDARGTVTLHLPDSDGPAARLAAGGETLLPHAFKLDATPGFERFLFVTSDSPFSTTAVSDALRPDSGRRLPAQLEVVELTLYKEMP